MDRQLIVDHGAENGHSTHISLRSAVWIREQDEMMPNDLQIDLII
jgi:hypothetical protein